MKREKRENSVHPGGDTCICRTNMLNSCGACSGIFTNAPDTDEICCSRACRKQTVNRQPISCHIMTYDLIYQLSRPNFSKNIPLIRTR